MHESRLTRSVLYHTSAERRPVRFQHLRCLKLSCSMQGCALRARLEILQPEQIVLLDQAITPVAAVNALDSAERHPWLPEGAPPEEPHSRGRLADLPGDAKLLVAQVGNCTFKSCSPSAIIGWLFERAVKPHVHRSPYHIPVLLVRKTSAQGPAACMTLLDHFPHKTFCT